MIRDIFLTRSGLVAVLLLLLWPTVGAAQDSYAAIEIHNNTSDLTVDYSVRWGRDDKWLDVRLRPGVVWSHWYPEDRQVPVLQITFNTGLGDVRNRVLYTLETTSTKNKLKGGRPYYFDRKKAGDVEVLELFTGTGKKAVAAAKGGNPQGAGDLVDSIWSGTETLPGYGALTFRFRADGEAIMTDKDGDTTGTWRKTENTVTLQFGPKLTYIGTIAGNTMKGTAATDTKNWTFIVSDPNTLVGTSWVGKETLPGYGDLKFRFLAGGKASMTDKDGDTAGTYKQAGSTVTLQFGKQISYTGIVDADTIKGDATNGTKNWTFSMTNPSASANLSPFQLGINLSNKGEYAQSIVKFSEAIKADPKSANPYSWRAYSYWSRGDFEKALEDCAEALRLEPNYSYAYNVRGLIYREQGEFEDAIKEHSRAIELAPKVAFFYSHRGLAHVANKNYEEAIKDQSEAIRLDPRRTDFLTRRGTAYLAIKDFERAIEDFSATIRLQPDVPLFYVNRGLGYLRAEQFDKSIADCTEALRLNPKLAAAHSNRGAAYFKKQQYQLAIQDCTESIRIDPGLGRAYWWRSQAYTKLGDRASAQTDYLKSIQLDPSNQQLSVDVENASRSFAPVVQRQEALRALRSFQLGGTLSPKRLYEINKFPQQLEPVEKPQSTLPEATRQLIKLEKIRHDALEIEMIAAADRFLSAAKLSPTARQAEGIDLQWLYGPVSSVKDRFQSQDDLGGMRLIGRLIFKDGREITAIFPVTFYPKIGEEGKNGEEGRRGQPGILWGADNFRIAVKLHTTGTVRQDYAHQSFSVNNKEDGTQSMQPGLNVDPKTGMLVDPYIRQSSLGTRCFDCHAKGTNLNLKGNNYYYNLMKEKNFKAMKGYDGYLKLAADLGATKYDLEELARIMNKDPALLVPVDELHRANEDHWIRRYPDFKNRLREPLPKEPEKKKTSAAPARRSEMAISTALRGMHELDGRTGVNLAILASRPRMNRLANKQASAISVFTPFFWRNDNAILGNVGCGGWM